MLMEDGTTGSVVTSIDTFKPVTDTMVEMAMLEVSVARPLQAWAKA